MLQSWGCWWMGLQAEGTAGTAGGAGAFGVTMEQGLHGGRVFGWHFLVTHLLDLFLWCLLERQDVGCPPLQAST